MNLPARTDKPALRLNEFHLIRANNPFDSKDITIVAEPAGRTIHSVLGIDFERHVILHNQKIVDVQEYHSVDIKPGDVVVYCPIPAGGDDDKGILRIIAAIVVTVVAWWAGGAYAGAGILGMSTATTGAVISAGIVMAGSLLINALLPITPMNAANQGLEASSPTYGIDGPKATAKPGVVTPMCYGTFRMGGNRVAVHTVNHGDQQYLYLLQAAGEGEISNIDGVLINDQPVSSYDGVKIEKRMGTENQSVIPWFADQITPVNRGFQMPSRTTFLHTTTRAVDQFRLDFTFLRGLYRIDDDNGDRHGTSVHFTISWRKKGQSSSPWLADDTFNVSANRTTPVRRSYTSPRLDYDTYEIRVVRTTGDGGDYTFNLVELTDVNEIVLDNVAYIYTALVAVQIKLSGQLSRIPNVTFLNHGRLINVWDTDSKKWIKRASNNPAWVTYDIITSRQAAGIDPERIDMGKWIEWAKFCDNNNLTFDGVFDVHSNVWDSMQYVFRCGRAQILQVGRIFSVAIERPTLPVMTFNSSNTIKDSFKLTWTPMSERANHVEISYYDKTNGYRETTVSVIDHDIIDFNKDQKTSRMTMIGVVDEERALREGQIALNMTKYLKRTVKFSAGIDSMLCTVGDVVFVQTQMADWAHQGRLLSGGSETVLKLDRPIEVDPNAANVCLVVHPAILRKTATVTDVIDNVVYVDAYYSDPARRMILPDGEDLPIADQGVDGQGPWFSLVVPPTALNIGESVEIWDIDVIEQRALANPTGEVEQVTVTSAYSAAPAAHALWMIGTEKEVRKLFRITKIDFSSEFEREIHALEYDERVYDDSGNSVVGVQPPPLLYVGQVRDLIYSVSVEYVGDIPQARVGLSWVAPLHGSYRGANIYVKYDPQSEFEPLSAVTAGSTSFSSMFAYNGKITLKVVAEDALGNSAQPFSDAPEVTIDLHSDLLENVQKPHAPTELKATGELMSVHLEWDFPPFVGYDTTEIWSGQLPDMSDGYHLVDSKVKSFEHLHLATNDTRYYQVRTRNILGQVSDFYPATPRKATTKLSSPALNNALKNQISHSELTDDLSGEIELISAPATVPGSVNQRIDESVGSGSIGHKFDDLRDLIGAPFLKLVLAFDNKAPGTVMEPIGWRGGNGDTQYVSSLDGSYAAYGQLTTDSGDWFVSKCFRLVKPVNVFSGSVQVAVKQGQAQGKLRFYRADAVYLGESKSNVLTADGVLNYSGLVYDQTDYVELILAAFDTPGYIDTIPLWFDGYDDEVPIKFSRQASVDGEPIEVYS